MGRRRERRDVGLVRKGRMPGPGNADETFPKQQTCQDACRGVDGNAECEARLATVEEIDDLVLTKNPADPHLETRRFDG